MFENYRFRLDYEAKEAKPLREHFLPSQLRGFPDMWASRQLLRDPDMAPVGYKGKLYPLGYLLDFYALIERHPEWEADILQHGPSRDELPPLELVLASTDSAARAQEDKGRSGG